MSGEYFCLLLNVVSEQENITS